MCITRGEARFGIHMSSLGQMVWEQCWRRNGDTPFKIHESLKHLYQENALKWQVESFTAGRSLFGVKLSTHAFVWEGVIYQCQSISHFQRGEKGGRDKWSEVSSDPDVCGIHRSV